MRLRPGEWGLRARFTAAAVAVVFVAVTCISIAVELAYPASLRAGVDQRLDNLVQVIGDDAAGGGGTSTALRTILAPARGGPSGGTAVIAWNGSRAIPISATAKSIVFTLPANAWQADGAPAYIDVTGAKPAGGSATFRFEIRSLDVPVTLQNVAAQMVAVGVSEDQIDAAVRQLAVILLATAGLGLLVAGGAGYVVSGRAVRPVTVLIGGVESVARDGDLSLRVPEGGTGNEIDRLSRAFNESLTRIEAMYKALEAVIVKQRRFVSDASHELRTPLTTVSSCLEMVHHFPEMPAPERQRVLDDALHEAHQMARLVDDLLTLARMDSGERRERVPFEWQALLEPCMADARKAAAPRSVVIDVDGQLGTGAGDVRTLQQLMTILVNNVAEHTPDSATMTLSAHRDGDGMVLGVADDGPGVPEEMLTRIFERFVRVDPSRHGAATGLGLAVAKAIVADHGGEIAAHNLQPHGLLVEARLPHLAAGSDRRRAPRPKMTPAPGATDGTAGSDAAENAGAAAPGPTNG